MTYGRSPYGKVPYGKAPTPTASGVTGTLAKTNANDTVSASGTTTIVGSLAKTNANDTCTASGTVGALGVTGSLATTNANDTSAASGTTTVVGSVSKTNTNDSVSASGTTTIVGSLAKTNANDKCVACGAAGSAQVGGGGIGYAYGYVGRKKSIKEEREELGIIPKTVKKIITKIAAKNDSYAKEPVAKVELKQNLESKGLQFKSTYEDELMKEIERNININLQAYLKKQKDIEDSDDEEAAMLLLM